MAVVVQYEVTRAQASVRYLSDRITSVLCSPTTSPITEATLAVDGATAGAKTDKYSSHVIGFYVNNPRRPGIIK